MKESKSAAAAMQEQVTRLLPGDVSVKWTESTGSTNDDAREAAAAGQPAVTVFGSEYQRSGRGRLERHWATGSGAAVEMSFLFRPRLPAAMLPGLNFAAALGICAGLAASCGVQAQVKWPNDVLVDGKKICGILSEASLLGGEVRFAVIGTGINVNQTAFPKELQGATSLRILTGRPQSRAAVAAACIRSVTDRVEKFAQGGFEAIMPEYRRLSAVLGRDVEVISADGVVAGRCVDFGEDGAIVIAQGQERRRFHASDVSLRGAGLHV